MTLPVNPRRRARPAQVAAPQPAQSSGFKFLDPDVKTPDARKLATASFHEAFATLAANRADEFRREVFEAANEVATEFVRLHLNACRSQCGVHHGSGQSV